MLLESQRSILLVVDVQERLAPAIAGAEALVERISTLLRAAVELDVPILATEQYSKGLGTTVAPLAGLLPPGSVVEKIHFNAAFEPGFVERVRELDRPQIVVTGTGFDCFLVADAVGSRDPENRHFGMERMRANGVEIVTSEMVMFEWLRRGSTPAFKRVLPLIR
jgi:nicotinamidase-related amidase